MRKPLKRSLYKIFVSLFVIVYSFIPPAIAIDDLSSYPQEETPSPIVEETETVEEVVLEDPVTVEEPPIVREKKDPQLDLNTENLIFATIQSFVSFVCTDVVDDTAGANDEPGQKDLTEMCADYLSGAVNIQWNWDDTAWSGANTGDGCALFDSDGDGFANYSLCVIVSGNPATYSTHILYSCSDTSTNKCFGSTPLTSTGIECSAFNDDTPTFGGDDDTTAQCTVQLSSVGGGELIDVCSYPSGQPNSDPSDCIIFQPKSGKLEVIKDLEPNLDPGLFNLLIDGMVYASNIGEGGTTGEEVLLAGTYTVSETAGTLTSLSDYTTSIECKDLNGTGSVIAFDTDSSVSVTIEEDTDVVCKITNTISGGTLIVKKIVTNDNGGNKTYSDFSFQVNSDSAIPFEIDGQNDLSVSPGTYTITEPSVTGYSTTYDNCTDVVVSSNETETCTITNNDIAPKLTLVKTVVNDDGGTKVVSDFPLFISLIPATSGVSYNLLANTQYVATETTQTGYAASVWGGDCNADGTITLQPGDNKTCTITNDDIAPQLTLVKVVVNDNGGTKAIEDFPLFIGDMQVVSGVASEVMANTQYTVSETNQTGYLASAWSGDCSVNGTITLLPGENKTCTITNDDIAPSLTLVKNVINNNGGTATAANWTLSATGPTTISGAGGAVSGVSFDAGTYTLSESGPTGYSASSWVCTGIQNSGTSITLGLGQSATCTIINDDIAPQLTVIKHVINDSDGTKLASDFTMSVLGTNVSVPSFPGSESGTTVTLNAGSYSVTETEDPIHYSRIDSSDCIGTIAIGEHKTCTITNNDIDHRPVIDVTKTANDISIPETGQDVLFTFTVENKSAEPVTINSLSDSVFGTLAGDIDCNVGTVLAIGGECSFTHSAFLSSDSLTSHINMFTAVANDNENNNATDSDNETVNFTDIPPQIRITKTANPTSVPETGGNVLFTFFVENIEQEDITLNSLVDDKFGNLDGQGTCDVPQTILIGGSYTCTVSKSLESNTLTSHVNVVIASATDDDGTPATDADDASVDFSDVPPSIFVNKVANPTVVPETGGDVTFTFTVLNTSSEESVTITSLNDSVYGTLAGDTDCGVGTELTSGAFCEFSITRWVEGDYSGPDHVNVFTGKAVDNEQTEATDNDDAIVDFSDVPPSIVVNKVANPTVVPETGGDVTFTFTVQNTSSEESVTILSLEDTVYGSLAGDADCQVNTVLAAGETCTFSISRWVEGDFTGADHVNVFTAVAEDDDGTPATDADDASVDFSDVPPSIFVNKVANPTVVPETGGDVTFTFTVLNTSSEESVTITSLNDSVYGTLAGDTDCGVGTELTSGAFCEFSITRWVEGDYSGPDHYNKFTAVAEDDDGTDATDDDDETVYLTDVWPTIEVTKTPNPTTVPETGANVTFTFTVKNTSSEEQVDITYLNDSDYGILTGDADCMLETVLIAGASCEFSIVRFVQGDYSGPDHNNIFTAKAEDNDNTEAIDTDDAIVEFTDVLPDISVLKTGNVSTVPETGGSVVFTYVVTNNSTEDGEITVLSDDKFGTLVGDADCYVGTVLSGGSSCSFEETFSIPAGIAPETHTNIFTATVIDDDGKSDTDTDDETITLTPVPSIKLVKEVVNMFGSDSDESDWVLYATGEVKSFWNYGDEGDFEYVAPGIPYILTEDGEGDLDEEFEASDWVCTGGSLVKNVLTLTSEDDVTCTITNTALPATIIVKKDVIDSDKEDIYSNDSFDIVLSQEGIIDTQDIKDTVEPDIAQFTRLDAGEYSISEIVTNGYKFNGCYPEYIQEEESIRDFFNPISQNPLIEVENGETVTYICENQVIEPILEIAKSNDSDVAGEMAGNTVTYTLIVTTPDDESEGTYVVNDVMVTDILPFGFIYQPGTWTAISSLRGDLKTLLITGEPGYGNGIPGEWNLGDMIEGETVTLTYVAETNLLQDPGIYKDIAWTEGESVLGAQVLGTSVTEPSSNFVRTQVLIIEPVEIGEGQVLGATITLPRTGAETYLTLGALISMILGFILLVFNPKKKIKTLLLASVLLLGVFTLVKPMPSYAAVESIDVQIEQPQTPTNANEFKIGFVALDIEGREISVQCYETTKGAFGSPIVANSGSCEVNSSLITANGTYEFYVIATAGSGSEAESKSSNKVTVQVDLDKPSPVTNYLKTKGTCTYTLTFKTANDGQTSNIQIFRSSVQPFLANSTTIIDEFPVTPNTDVSYTDNDVLDCSKEYYYAIRAVDVFNNTSTFVTDNIVKVVIVQGTTTTGTGTTTTTTGGEVAGEETVTPDGTGGPDEGEVAGEETTNGGEADDNGTPNEEDEEDTGTDTKEATFWDWFKYVLIALGGIILATVGYTYVRSRQSRN